MQTSRSSSRQSSRFCWALPTADFVEEHLNDLWNQSEHGSEDRVLLQNCRPTWEELLAFYAQVDQLRRGSQVGENEELTMRSEEQRRQIAEEIGEWLGRHSVDFVCEREQALGEAGWREGEWDYFALHKAHRAEAFQIFHNARTKGWVLPDAHWIEAHLEAAWHRSDNGVDRCALFTAFRPTWDQWCSVLETLEG